MAEPADARDPVQPKSLQPQHNVGQDAEPNPGPSNTTSTTTAASKCQYLTLKPLKKLDLPHHPAYDNAASDHNVSLVQFLDNLFSEVRGIDWDKDFENRGTWSSEKGHVMMPPTNATESNDAVAVPVSVEKRIKDLNQAKWAVRSSTHSNTHVEFSELGDLLAKDHSRNEAIYTPSVFDALELLKWDHEELLKAVQQSVHREEIHSVEMFSEIPIWKAMCLFGLLLKHCSIPNVPYDAQGRWPQLITRPRVSCVDRHCKYLPGGQSL
jgi:hypothetical protein